MRARRCRACQCWHGKEEGCCKPERHGTGVTRASICVLGVVANYKCSCKMSDQRPVRDHEGMVEIERVDPGSSRHRNSLNESRQDGLLVTGAVPVTRQRSDRVRKQTGRGSGRGWLWAGGLAYDKSDRNGSHNHVGG